MSPSLISRRRSGGTSGQRMLLLAPDQATLPAEFGKATRNKDRYNRLLSKMQRFRGETYVKDGAITPASLDSEGRHRLDIDLQSWHVLVVNGEEGVCGCSRYSTHRPGVDFGALAVGRSAMAYSDVWGAKLRTAVERERRIAAERNTSFVEVGGWAISEQLRGTTEALRIALATYGLAQNLGGCIGITTATVRHHSANVLRKIGGQSLMADSGELPRYFDPQYGCDMEILRFHSNAPNTKFLPWIEQLHAEMSITEVVTPLATTVPSFSPALVGGEGHLSNRLLSLELQLA